MGWSAVPGATADAATSQRWYRESSQTAMRSHRVIGCPDTLKQRLEIMDLNSDLLAGMRSHFKQWDDAVGVLVAEGKRADGEARTAYQRRLKELRLARNAAQRAFDTLLAATGTAATRSQAAMQEARDVMQETLLKVTADLHTPPPDARPTADVEPEAPVHASSATVASATLNPIAREFTP